MPLVEVLAGLRQAAFVLRLYHMHGPAAAVDRAIELLTPKEATDGRILPG